MKVVLVNSIGVDSKGFYIIHSPSRWSQGVKNIQNWFAYYPWELAYLSSLLKRETDFSIKLIDGCLKRDNYESLYNKIYRENPDWLVMECSSRVFSENFSIAKKIRDELKTRLVFVGQHASAFPAELIKEGVDYVCIGEYEATVVDLLKGAAVSEIAGLYPNKRRDLIDIENLPLPEDSDISRISYAYPGEPSSEFIEVEMYATRGCLRQCNFCVASNAYYNKPNYRLRHVDSIIDEIKYLKNKHPAMEGIFFDEEVHNANKDFTLKLCNAIIENRLNYLRFEAMCDILFFDADMLRQMKRAGYYKIRFGVETSSLSVMRSIGKVIPKGILTDRLKEAKSAGLKTYGAFTFGALGSTRDSDSDTIRSIKKLISDDLIDNLQMSICTPQPGTPFYKFVKENNLLATCDFDRFDGGNFAVVNYHDYRKEDIEDIAYLGYLIRDHSYLWKKISGNQLYKWLSSVYKKYGLINTARKIIKRIRRELSFYYTYIWQKSL